MAQSPEQRHRIAARRARVAELVLQGVPNDYEIALRLGLSGDTGRRIVAYDRAALLTGWKAAAVRDLDAAKGRELARLDLIESEAWAAWEKSKQPREPPGAAGGTRRQAAGR
jgi:hypothetical protein